ASVWGHSISFVDLRTKTVATLPLGTNAPVTMPKELPPPVEEDEAAITKRADALLDKTRPEDPFPYGSVLDEQRQRLYERLWAQSAAAVIDTAARRVLGRWTVEAHPNEMLLTKSGQRLFVANANRNTVSVLDPASGKIIETLVAELRPESHP